MIIIYEKFKRFLYKKRRTILLNKIKYLKNKKFNIILRKRLNFFQKNVYKSFSFCYHIGSDNQVFYNFRSNKTIENAFVYQARLETIKEWFKFIFLVLKRLRTLSIRNKYQQ